MSKQYNIRWSEADNTKLQRAVKNFNAKVTRLQKKYADTDVIIPEKVSMKEMRELVNTRRDLNRELKSLQRFTERGSEFIVDIPNTDHNIQVTKWQKDEMTMRARVVNRRRNKRRKDLEERELEQGGKPLGYTVGDIGMGKVDKVALRPTKPFTKSMSKHEVKAKMEHLRRESQSDYWNKKDYMLRDNYIKALKENYNERDIQDVIKSIEEMDIEDFKDKLFKNPEDFNTAYPPSQDEYIGYILQLKTMWVTGDDMIGAFVPRYHEVKKPKK